MRALIVGVVIALFIGGCSKESETAQFWKSDFVEAAKTAQKAEKNILVILSKDTCPWCKKLKNETLSDPQVLDLIRQNFIPVFLESPKDNKEIEKSGLTSRAVPATILLDTKGREFGRVSGFVDKDIYIAEIKRLIE